MTEEERDELNAQLMQQIERDDPQAIMAYCLINMAHRGYTLPDVVVSIKQVKRGD